jgi:hypothetical protein
MRSRPPALLLLGLVLACGPGRPRADPAARSPAAAIADGYLAGLARLSPETGTTEDLPGTDHGALTDNTGAGIARRQAWEDSLLGRLKHVTTGPNASAAAGYIMPLDLRRPSRASQQKRRPLGGRN